MNKNVLLILTLVVLQFSVSLGLISAKAANAAVQNSPTGAWKVSGEGANGSIGDVVPIKFSVTHVLDRCTDVEIAIETLDEARQKVSFTSATAPAGSSFVSPERVSWPPSEFENDVARTYQVQARIDQGIVGDEIKGFNIIAVCSGKSLFRGVVDDIKITIIEKKQDNIPKKVVTPLPAPSKIITLPTPSPGKVFGATITTPKKTVTTTKMPSSLSAPAPSASIIADIKDSEHTIAPTPVLTTVSPQMLDSVQKESSPSPSLKSRFGHFALSVRSGFQAITNWFFRLHKNN